MRWRGVAAVVLLAGCSESSGTTELITVWTRQDEALASRLRTSRPWSGPRTGTAADQMITALLPEAADGFARIGSGNRAVRLRVRDAAPSKLRLQGRTALYPEVHPFTDALVYAGADWLEHLWVLRDERASRTLALELDFDGPVRELGGGLEFLDARGEALFRMSAPVAIDARGKHHALKTRLTDRVFSLELVGDQLSFPVLIDPVITVTQWHALVLPGRTEHATAELGSRVVLFGGVGGGGTALGDTWDWDGTRWFRHAVPGPPGRRRHTMTTVGDKVLLFGGESYVSSQLNDLWEWNGTVWNQRNPITSPPPRNQHGAAALGSSLLIFGGYTTNSGAAQLLGDTWLWNGSRWTEVQSAGPSPRLGPAMATFGNKIILFGGAAIGTNGTDGFWEWNGTAWNPIPVAGAKPSPRFGASMVKAGNKLVLQGGNTGVRYSLETWEWDGTTWALRSSVAPSVQGRLASFQNEALLIGGGDAVNSPSRGAGAQVWRWSANSWTALTNDAPHQDGPMAERGASVITLSDGRTWSFDGDQWTLLQVASPPSRTGAAMATVGDKTILFGGQDLANTRLNDTWEWDGIRWTQKTVVNSPSPRSNHAMARRGTNVVLFGGRTPTGASAETWEWDGTNWLDRTSAGPSARNSSAMASMGSHVVLYGGETNVGQADTWEWDGTNWTQRFALSPPGARTFHAMAPFNGGALLFGGQSGSVLVGTTWFWDGSTWAQFTDPGPAPRSRHSLAARGSTVVLYGGDETWEFLRNGGLGSTCSSDAECLSRACVDGVCCNTSCGGGQPDCEACSVDAGSVLDGTCSILAAGWQCRPSTNFCDFAEACTGNSNLCPPDLHLPALTPCRAASCENDFATLAGRCSATGTCPLETQACGAAQCAGDRCDGCATDAQCAMSQWCRGGVCGPRLVLGSVCSVDRQCQSGVCVDAVCCSSPCRGQCEACNSSGQCVSVTGTPIGGRPACITSEPTCAGSCDGIRGDACTYPRVGTCKPEQCIGNQYTAPGTCDGAGACASGPSASCAPGRCSSTNACTLECTLNSECSAGAVCIGQVCRVRGPCTDSSQCTSRFCVDGVCCDRKCDGTCEACDVAGRAGTCTPVSGAPHGQRPGCSGEGTCRGTCDGIKSTACSFPTTTCAAPRCVEGAAQGSRCNGRGVCLAEDPVSCQPLACRDGRCLTSCSGPEDCTAETSCDAGTCVAPTSGCGCGATDLPLFAALVLLLGRLRPRRPRERRPRGDGSRGGR